MNSVLQEETVEGFSPYLRIIEGMLKFVFTLISLFSFSPIKIFVLKHSYFGTLLRLREIRKNKGRIAVCSNLPLSNLNPYLVKIYRFLIYRYLIQIKKMYMISRKC